MESHLAVGTRSEILVGRVQSTADFVQVLGLLAAVGAPQQSYFG